MNRKCAVCGRFRSATKPCKQCEASKVTTPSLSSSLPDPLPDLLAEDLELVKTKESLKSVKSKYSTALQRIDDLQRSLSLALSLNSSQSSFQPDLSSENPVTYTSKETTEAIPILLWSDWHPGEYVDPKTVNDINTYNIEVFKSRVDALLEEAHRIIEMLRQRFTIDTAVIWLGGDLITGYIHPELMESNTLSPTQEVLLSQEVILKGLNYLIEEAGLDKLIVPCSFGNHGRTGEKMKVSTAHINSYEWLMYKSLQLSFTKDPRVEFYVSDGHIFYLNIWDKVLRFTHGDAIKYQGGIGGLTVPLIKWIHRQDQVRKADMTFLGHFHTLQFHHAFTTNSSLIGPTAYSLRLGFPPEPPQQALVLLEKEKGFTLRCPVLAQPLEDKT
jgi:hypothetical protein